MTSPLRGAGILDTNLVILLPQLRNSGLLPGEPVITTITLAELSAGPLTAVTDSDVAERQGNLQLAETAFDALPFDRAAARAFGQVSADLRAAGRKPSARTYDALIAAIAIANGLPLYTANPDDFVGISGLEVVAVPHPDRT